MFSKRLVAKAKENFRPLIDQAVFENNNYEDLICE